MLNLIICIFSCFALLWQVTHFLTQLFRPPYWQLMAIFDPPVIQKAKNMNSILLMYWPAFNLQSWEITGHLPFWEIVSFCLLSVWRDSMTRAHNILSAPVDLRRWLCLWGAHSAHWGRLPSHRPQVVYTNNCKLQRFVKIVTLLAQDK